jgi:DNA replication protein DnaC
MSLKSIYKQVMREYEDTRKETNLTLKQRHEEVYKLIPTIKEIDLEIKMKGINLYKLAVNKDVKEELIEMKKRNESLLQEKGRLIEQFGIEKDYLKIFYKCDLCKDTGYIFTQKCNCLKQKLINKYYDISNLSDVIETENFDTFDFRYYSEEIEPKNGVSPYSNIQKIYRECMGFVNNFDKDFVNIFLYGGTGLGKTFLCNCIAKDLLENNKSVIYVTAPRFFKKIEEERFGAKGTERDNNTDMEIIFSCDILIIDDLGTEFSTIITNTELFNIINTRLLEKKPTVISSNLSLNELRNHYSDRILSRLVGNFKAMKIYGDDIRIKKQLGIEKK